MDYLEFFGLKEHPFSNVVDNRFYYNSAQHANALLRLRYSIENKRGLSVVIGDIGSGKTTLARRLLEDLDEAKYEAALLVIIHSSVCSEWLLKKMALQLGIEDVKDDKVELLGQLYRRLIEIHEEGKSTVVLIDEVQMLNSREIMEEFRGLLNMETDGGKLINFAFFGLTELEKVMGLDEPLKQRIAMRVSLKSFDEQDTREYVLHRLRVAGGSRQLFSERAVREIFCYSKGRPRLINTICDNALLEGFLVKAETVDEALVKTAAIDLGLENPCGGGDEVDEMFEALEVKPSGDSNA
jgi:type II secretory pathway predicted ATPase ExeA